MSQLTKQQRYEIYKKALELYKEGRWSGLCPCISDAGREENIISIYFNEVLDYFPEFAKFKPEELIYTKSDEGLWWPRVDRESRIKCLEHCIKVTTTKQNLFTQLKQWI